MNYTSKRDYYRWWITPGEPRTWLFALCLGSPILFSIIRKFVPGQPSWVRSAAFGVIGIAAAWSFLDRESLPNWLRVSLWCWAGLQAIYFFPLVSRRPEMSPFVGVVYFVPLFLCRIGYITVRRPGGFVTLGKIFGTVIGILFGGGFLAVALGTENLPFWLQATAQARDAGENVLKGSFFVPSLFFSTVRVLAHSLMGLIYFIYLAICVKQIRQESRLIWWIIAIASLLLLYLLGRRAVMMATLPGLLFCIYRERYTILQTVLMGAVISTAVWYVEDAALLMAEGPAISGRTELYENLNFVDRIELFISIVQQWLSIAPWGEYLGYASPIARSFGISQEYYAVEFGAAQLVAEMGVWGLIGLPLLVSVLLANMMWRSWFLGSRYLVWLMGMFILCLFGLYYLKSLSFLMIGTIDNFMFWGFFGASAGLLEREKGL